MSPRTQSMSQDFTIKAPPSSLASIENGFLRMKPLPSTCPPPKAALIGVLGTTGLNSTAHRQILRETYRRVNAKLDWETQIDFMFVFGNALTWEAEYELTLEEMTYPEDTHVLEREENMNDGKTMDWLGYARTIMYIEHPTEPGKFCLRYRFIGKTDDDSVIHIPRLSEKLLKLPAQGPHYVGRYHNQFMAGLGYLMSPDLIEWIHHSPIPGQHALGHEDYQVGFWFREAKINNTIQFHDQGFLFHDLEESNNFARARSTKESIVIHLCKDMARMFRCIADLYGTPPVAMKRLSSAKSLELHKQRLLAVFPDLKSTDIQKSFERATLSDTFNAASQVDAALIRPIVEKIMPTLIRDPVSEEDWMHILTHISARIYDLKRADDLKDTPIERIILRAVNSIGVIDSAGWNEDRVAKTMMKIIKEQGPLTWEQVNECRKNGW
ncbi:hypothetical protein HDU79_006106 [Rhizoclosmatium sp. JEL0117]|nr:hypothetical protein HDU79_006106 [Rhizoclosmatium sp. JEL0117]